MHGHLNAKYTVKFGAHIEGIILMFLILVDSIALR